MAEAGPPAVDGALRALGTRAGRRAASPQPCRAATRALWEAVDPAGTAEPAVTRDETALSTIHSPYCSSLISIYEEG